jgi:uncharacterized protein
MCDASRLKGARPMDNELLKDILTHARTIAVVGLSRSPGKESHIVARYLQGQGYRIIPVNPSAEELLGEKSYPDLLSIPESVDIVNIFRPSSAVMPIALQAVEINSGSIWMQVGIVHHDAARLAAQAGLRVVMDRCIMVDHQKLRLQDTQ